MKKERLLELAGLEEAAPQTYTLKVNLNKELFDQIRKDQWLAEDHTDEEIAQHVIEFLDQMKTPRGLSLILENLESFNY